MVGEGEKRQLQQFIDYMKSLLNFMQCIILIYVTIIAKVRFVNINIKRPILDFVRWSRYILGYYTLM